MLTLKGFTENVRRTTIFYKKGGRHGKEKSKSRSQGTGIFQGDYEAGNAAWINTLGVLGLAYYCVHNNFDAAFPWLSAMVSLPWAAWGVSKTGYTMKSVKENTSGGIVYESAMREEGGTE